MIALVDSAKEQIIAAVKESEAGVERKAGGHSRGISIPGMRSDLLALPASRLGGLVEG